MPAHVDRKSYLDSLAVAVGGIWAAVLVISLFSPDMVSGSEQQHLPVAAFTTWIWGLVATNAVFKFWVSTRRTPGQEQMRWPVSLGVAVVWAVAAGVSVLGPVMVTGTDPTRLPLCAILAPLVAMVLTMVARAAADLVGEVLDEDVPRSAGPADRQQPHQASPETMPAS